MQNIIIRLLQTNPYYANLLLQLKRVATTTVHTAGVALPPAGPVLYYNPRFLQLLTKAQQEDVLIHECWHLLALHPIRGKKFSSHSAFNIAADKAINQNIPGMQERWESAPITPVFLSKEDVAGLCAEAYYKPEDSDGGGFDDHGEWYTGPTMSEAQAKAEMGKIAKNAAKAVGNVPGELQDLISALGDPEVGWQALLRQFVARANEYIRVDTRSRRNRRFGLMYPGKKNESVLHLAVAIDTSGSVSNEELGRFLTEINGIYRTGAVITLIEADADIQRVSKYQPVSELALTGRGGTLYGPALKRAEKEGADAVIYFGDMDAADKPEKPSIPVLWVSSRGVPAPAPFGKTIFL